MQQKECVFLVKDIVKFKGELWFWMRSERASGFVWASTRSFSISLPFSFFRLFLFRLLMPRWQLGCSRNAIRVYLYPTMTTTRRIKVKNTTATRTGGDYAAARSLATLFVTRVHTDDNLCTYRSRLPVSGNGVVTGNHRRPAGYLRVRPIESSR